MYKPTHITKDPLRHELAPMVCQRCGKPDADLVGCMVSHDKGRWVTWEDYLLLKRDRDLLDKKEEVQYKMRKEFESLYRKAKADIERLTKAGDLMDAYIKLSDGTTNGMLNCRTVWHLAKEGKENA
jgi:hypothetical protein